MSLDGNMGSTASHISRVYNFSITRDVDVGAIPPPPVDPASSFDGATELISTIISMTDPHCSSRLQETSTWFAPSSLPHPFRLAA
ncbi:hypothetical protein D9619_012425 [Psilocybe cf. subviscida]|uniref:Uncharacterized protein n=1 Tax=Psilocybe cf. subviscida TaxID=2480587 RepID=A0A8H5ARL4_9AGAR|nr:hypothetical protein D9619_012425 [Psilocybe cf. subviscida]